MQKQRKKKYTRSCACISSCALILSLLLIYIFCFNLSFAYADDESTINGAVNDAVNAPSSLGTIEELFGTDSIANSIARTLDKNRDDQVTQEELDRIEELRDNNSPRLTEANMKNLHLLRNLKTLDFYKLSCTDTDLLWEQIAQLEQLESLRLNADFSTPKNHFTVKVPHLPKLKSLKIDGWGAAWATDVTVSSRRKLGTIYQHDISSINHDNLPVLEELSFSISAVKDFSPLATLTTLKTLNLSFTHLHDLSVLQPLQHLETLTARQNNIVNFSPLARLSSLKNVDLGAQEYYYYGDRALKFISYLDQIDLVTPVIGADGTVVAPAGTNLSHIDYYDRKSGLIIVGDFNKIYDTQLGAQRATYWEKSFPAPGAVYEDPSYTVIEKPIYFLYKFNLPYQQDDGQPSSVSIQLVYAVNKTNEGLMLHPAPTVSFPNPIVINVGDSFDVAKDVKITVNDKILPEDFIRKNISGDSVNVKVPGSYSVEYSITDNIGAKVTKTRTVIVNAYPTITITPRDKVITQGAAFDPLKGVSAHDKEDGDLDTQSLEISYARKEADGSLSPLDHLDTQEPGDYQISYIASDKYGAKTTETAQLSIKPAPVMTLDKDPFYLQKGEDFDINTIRAHLHIQDYHGEVSPSPDNTTYVIIGTDDGVSYDKLSTEAPKWFKISWSYHDDLGAKASVDTRVYVNEAPVITGKDLEITAGDNFDALKQVEVTDLEDGGVPPVKLSVKLMHIQQDGTELPLDSIDTSKPGNYKLIYTAKDSMGGVSTLELKLTIKEKPQPAQPQQPGTTRPYIPVSSGDKQTDEPKDTQTTKLNHFIPKTSDSSRSTYALLLAGLAVGMLIIGACCRAKMRTGKL